MGLDPKKLPRQIIDKIHQEAKRAPAPSAPKPPEPDQHQIKGERELQQQLVGYLRTRGIIPMVPIFGRKTRVNIGWPDVTFSYYGYPCVWEVKFGKGKLSEDQIRMSLSLSDHPNYWRWCVIRSVEEAKAFLDGIEKEASTQNKVIL